MAAYRFLLEVPEPLAFEVLTAVTSVPDAQVHHIRNSQGLGFDDPFVSLTVAAHSFAVVDSIYRWMVDSGQPYPDIRLVMHDGRRVSLPKANVSLVTAAIRRDQPWIDHTMPQIGVHEPMPWLEGSGQEGVTAVPALVLNDPASLARRVEETLTIPVHNPAPAEQFYEEMFDLHVVGRAMRAADDTLRSLGDDYDPRLARLRGDEADVVFMENGPFKLNLRRVSRGYPLPYGETPVQVHTTATPEQMATIRGRVLMNSYNLIEGSPGLLRFIDPYNVAWTITPTVAAEQAPPAALQG